MFPYSLYNWNIEYRWCGDSFSLKRAWIAIRCQVCHGEIKGQVIPAHPSNVRTDPHHSILYFTSHTMPTCYTVIPFLSSRRTVHPISSTSASEFKINNMLRCLLLITSLPVSRIGPLCWTWAWWTLNKCCGTGSVLVVLVMRCDETPQFMKAFTLIYRIYLSKQYNIHEYNWIYMNTLPELGKQAEKKMF